MSHIQPGKPQQNAYVERYNRTVRHQWLDRYIIESIEEAQEFATQWLWTYNNERSNLGRHNARTEAENGRVNSTAEPRSKTGGYRGMRAGRSFNFLKRTRLPLSYYVAACDRNRVFKGWAKAILG